MEENKPASLADEMKEIKALLKDMHENKQEKQENPVPFFKRLWKGNLKKNYVLIQYVAHNRSISFYKMPILEGILYINDKPYIATTDYMLNFKGRPFIIICEWSILPFSPQDHMEETVEKKAVQAGYRLIANRLEGDAIKAKQGMSMTTILGVIVVLIVIGYFVTKKGG